MIVRASGLASVSTHEPAGVIPTAITSNRRESRLRRMLPADTHEMACSLLRPPNTTATRTRRSRRSLALTTCRGYRVRQTGSHELQFSVVPARARLIRAWCGDPAAALSPRPPTALYDRPDAPRR
ncbi:Uncharacterised protein [Mycobacterium tuberculosis]|uniref:Uncharacterized protein n=1 Tax=Mycobacterium tuberculosis TaxID=1773 RepID=A0A655JGX1_MYCTX|nr:Uncharacterised protein [Mycobacterium tuberculosis]